MKFTKIKLIGASVVELPIVGADPSGPFIFKGAEGFGPTEIAVRIAEHTGEGGVYQGRKPANKQPVIRIGLQPEWDYGQTPEELRVILYGLLTPRYGQMVRMEFWNEGVFVAQAEGQLSRFEAGIFTSDPEVQITMETVSPYFLSPTGEIITPTRTIESGSTILTIPNEGDAPAGFRLDLVLRQTASSILLADDSASGEYISINNIAWVAGDRLVIDTRFGARGIWRIASGTSAFKSILNNMSSDSIWMQLYGGTNRLKLSLTQFDFSPEGFFYRTAYWGV